VTEVAIMEIIEDLASDITLVTGDCLTTLNKCPQVELDSGGIQTESNNPDSLAANGCRAII
jgi:hypothetical protein